MAKLTRRTFLSSGAGLLLLSIVPTGEAHGTPQFVAVRIWPASSYTRATLESTRPLQHKYFLLDNPRRLVVDIQGASLDSVVQSLPQKLSRSDPYVAGIRVGQFNPDTIRVVMDLKTAVNPQVFSLAPVANFKHRLVIDLYPTQAVALAQEANDPLMALLQDYTNGRIQANIDAADARLKTALLQYDQTLLQALADVDNAYQAQHALNAQQQELQQAERTAKQQVRNDRQLFRYGRKTLDTALQSQLSAHGFSQNLLDNQLASGLNLLNLYKAIGSGWQEEGTQPEAAEAAAK